MWKEKEKGKTNETKLVGMVGMVECTDIKMPEATLDIFNGVQVGSVILILYNFFETHREKCLLSDPCEYLLVSIENVIYA